MLPSVVPMAGVGINDVGIGVLPGLLVPFVDAVSTPLSPTQVLVLVALVGAIAYLWYVDGRDRWYAVASDRLLYGVPWGTAVSLLGVTSFYLFVQRGLWHWSEPLFLPFVSWSYFYPTGMLTAGIAHASPSHFLSNFAAALTLGPIAEYAWSHYAPERRGSDGDEGSDDERSGAETSGDSGSGDDGSDDITRPSAIGFGVSVLDRPWVRAVVVFPIALFVVAYVTSVLSLGPSLGFSGAVFALAGFAVVTYPLASVVAILGARAIGRLFDAVAEPVVRGTVETGPPAPPSWAGVAFQAHFVGFLIGVLLGLALLHWTDRRPSPGRIFLATLLFGMVQGLWLIVLRGGQDVYLLYQGVGVAGLLVLTTLITAAVAGDDADEPRLQQLAGFRPVRLGVTVVLVAVTVLVVLPSPFAGLTIVDSYDEHEPALEGVTVEDYTVTYAENEPIGSRFPFEASGDQSRGTASGVIVASPDREIWTVATNERLLAHYGEATVAVGDVGWHESVTVERSGWELSSGETAYAVDVAADGDERRVFQSDPASTDVEIDHRTLYVTPSDDGFRVLLQRDGTEVASAPVPAAGDSTSVGDLTIATEENGDRSVLFVSSDDLRVPIAERELYGG